jgi:hypothetical protein
MKERLDLSQQNVKKGVRPLIVRKQHDRVRVSIGPYFSDSHSLLRYLTEMAKAWTNCEIFMAHHTETAPNPKKTTKR